MPGIVEMNGNSILSLSKSCRVFVIVLLASVTSILISAEGFAYDLERRRNQFEETPGYLVMPAPYSYPGIGEGLMLIGYAGNVLESPVDLYFIGFSGEAEGYYAMVNDLYLWPRMIYLNFNQLKVSKFGVIQYTKRGMDSVKDDHFIFVGEHFQRNAGKLSLSLSEKRWEFWAEMVSFAANVSEIKDPDGDLVSTERSSMEGERYGVGAQLDFTDDKADPRSGLRFKFQLSHAPSIMEDSPEYDVFTWGVTAYLPLLDNSTLAFHLSRSDATVNKKGETNLETLKTKNGYYTCPPIPGILQLCQAAKLADASNTLNANKNGTSLGLGGTDRLRSYPMDRFIGAHTLFYGTEFRWNINTEKTNLNLYFLQDIIQAFQLALFWEQGSVSESASELGDLTRSSTGFGFRLVAESGNAYRLDWATGDEGAQLTILFQYPWGESE